MAKISFIFLLLLVASFFEAAAANSCSWGNFYCSTSNRCISSQWRCDGKNDCTYGEDEQSCPTACSNQRSQFRCNDLRCITRSYVCDGDNDCGDNSDESSYLCGVRRTGTGLRCYSCSSSSSSCSTTSCSYYSGYGYCYRKTYDRTVWGSTTRVTVAGCRSSCSTSYKTAACSGLSNCRMSCCRTSLCNSASSTTDSPYPSCYTCTSTSSYKDCEKKAKLTRCSSTAASCYKMDYKVTTSYAEASLYSKGCTTSYACSQMKSTSCRTSYTDCNVYCCKGNKCNAGSIQRFSVVILVTCAVAFLVLG